MMDDRLEVFCATYDSRFCLSKPCVVEGYRYYTDGRIVVRVPDLSPNTVLADGVRYPVSIREFKQWELVGTEDNCISIEPGILPRVLETSEFKKCDMCRGIGRGNFRECRDCGGDGRVYLIAHPSKTRYRCECKHCRDGIANDGDVEVRCPSCGGMKFERGSFCVFAEEHFYVGFLAAILKIDPAPSQCFIVDKGTIYLMMVIDFRAPGGEPARAIFCGLVPSDRHAKLTSEAKTKAKEVTMH